jgi:dephospho-CoA kinase
VHPLVTQALDWMIQRSSQPVIVIEAIKLLEANLHKQCDSVWVVYAPPAVQLARLVHKRGMNEAEARQRIGSQSPQEQKMAAANVVIKNNTTFDDAWRQVTGAWTKFVPVSIDSAQITPARPAGATGSLTKLSVVRGKPRDSEIIAALINKVKKPMPAVTKSDIMADFGEKAFLLVKAGDQMVGVAGWQVENLVARTTEIVIDPLAPAAQVLPILVTEMERSSRDLQCEAALVFTQPDLSVDNLWQGLGYERRTPQSLGVAVWQEAALETLKPGHNLFFKQLRQDRVLRPI